jgi:hypothetical protein
MIVQIKTSKAKDMQENLAAETESCIGNDALVTKTSH